MVKWHYCNRRRSGVVKKWNKDGTKKECNMITHKVFPIAFVLLLSATAAFVYPKRINVAATSKSRSSLGMMMMAAPSGPQMTKPDITAEVGDEIQIEVDRVQLPENCRFKYRYEVANPDDVFYNYDNHPNNLLVDRALHPDISCGGGSLFTGGQANSKREAITYHEVLAHQPGIVTIKYNRLTDTGCFPACGTSNNPGACMKDCEDKERRDPNNINKDWPQKSVVIEIKK